MEPVTSDDNPSVCELAEASDQMLLFEKGDSEDLIKIMETVDLRKNIPEDMKLLWEMQMTQLAAKSVKGHRWHPRFVISEE